MHLAFTSPLLHYLVFTDLLTSKFSALNIRLENISTDVTTTPLQTISTKINSVFRLHTHLHVVVWDVNAHFCLYNLLSITTRLAVIVLEMYAYLMSISEGDDYRHHDYNGFVFMFSEVVFLVTQCLLCHACAKEANRTVMIAHHLLQPETPTRLWEEVGVFSRLTLNNKVSFSVGGIFTLDRPFLTKVAMTSLSYLIIAVQLKDVRLSGSDGPKTNGTGSGVENSTSYSNSTFSYTSALRLLYVHITHERCALMTSFINPSSLIKQHAKYYKEARDGFRAFFLASTCHCKHGRCLRILFVLASNLQSYHGTVSVFLASTCHCEHGSVLWIFVLALACQNDQDMVIRVFFQSILFNSSMRMFSNYFFQPVTVNAIRGCFFRVFALASTVKASRRFSPSHRCNTCNVIVTEVYQYLYLTSSCQNDQMNVLTHFFPSYSSEHEILGGGFAMALFQLSSNPVRFLVFFFRTRPINTTMTAFSQSVFAPLPIKANMGGY
ncbi:hypothetical protein J6590_097004 [Homalodisca vitripennis]|nr:hypothetical protein J6590_097004 [Homalodisca vitripennis]